MAAPDAAITMLRRALEEGAPDPPRAAVLAELGFAEVAGRDLTAIEHLREALTTAAEPTLRVRVAAALCEIMSNAGQWESACDVLQTELDALGEVAPEILLELHALWTMSCVFDTRLADEFDTARERAQALPPGDSWPGRALDAMVASAAALRGGSATRFCRWSSGRCAATCCSRSEERARGRRCRCCARCCTSTSSIAR